MSEKNIRVMLEELAEDICDNYCKYQETCDDNAECDIVRGGGSCPLDILF